MKKPKPIRSILDQTLKSLEIDVPLKAHTIWGAWREIVGDPVSLHAQPRAIRNRILFIDVSHSTWIQQLQFLKPTLIEKINAYLGEPLIEEIRFKLGKISSPVQETAEEPGWRDEKLHKGMLIRIEDLLQNIKDEETKKELREVLTRAAKLEEHRKKTRSKG